MSEAMSGAGLQAARIEGLCTWRAALMLGGLVTHGAMGFHGNHAMDLLVNTSHAFRMGVFFVIAGFLSSPALQRRPRSEQWLFNRLVQIGVPALFGLAVLSPIVSTLMLLNPEENASPLFFDWYHLWFLYGLLIYSVMAYGLHHLDLRYDLFARLDGKVRDRRVWQLRSLLSLTVVIMGLKIATGNIVGRLAPPEHLSTYMQWQLIVGYAPLFLLGFALSRSRALLGAVTGDIRLPLAFVSVFAVAYVVWHLWLAPLNAGQEFGSVEIALTELGAAFCPPSAAALILRSSLRIKRVPRLVRDVSDASFTIYLLHYPLIVAAKAALAWVLWEPWVEFSIAVLFSGLVSYGFHRVVVRRSALASLLLNGRHHCALPESRTPRADLRMAELPGA